MRKYLNILNIVVSMLMCVSAFAQDIQFTAEVDQRQVALGESLQLTFTVTGTQDVPEIQVPDIDGLDIRYLGPSTRISIVNGQYSSSKSWIYSMIPLKTGRFTIPAVTITVNGQSYASDPLEIEVSSAATPSLPPHQQGTASLEDKIFLALKLPREKVFLNERLPVKVLLFIADVSVADVHLPELQQPGLDAEKFGQPRQYAQVINGIRYHIAEFDTHIYPGRVGEMAVGPVTLECNIVLKSAGAATPFGGSVFDEDFFNAFFDRYEKRPLALQSKTSTLTVLPLPEENKPADFAGAVGRFNMDVALAPAEVNVGDPITLKINIGGEGNFKTVEPPAFKHLDQLKVYDPQIKEEGGFKKMDQVLIPESDRIREVPAVRFSYFDPTLGQYQTISKGPFPVTVHLMPSVPSGVVSSGAGPAPQVSFPQTVGEDIVFIKESPGEFYAIGRRFYRTVPFCLVLAGFGGVWGILFAAYCRREKIATDIVYARRLLAPREARRGLQEARRCQTLEDPRKFYDALFRTLQKYLGHKLHLPAGALTYETIRTRLGGRVAEKWLANIRELLRECDAVRYASADSSPEARTQSYTRLQQTIDALERVKI